MKNSNAIIVLGMHRSGTSLLTRILNLLGMNLGQPLLPKHRTNQTGFWEHKTIVTFNEKLLHQLRSQWDDPRIISEQDQSSVTLANIQRSLAKTLYQNFAASTLWGIKDPRLCRLLPFWLPLLENTGSNLHFIHILREPLEVAASLQRRDQFTLEHSLLLWLTHVLESEQHTCYYSRVFVTYDELLHDWQATIEKIAQILQITFPHPIQAVKEEISHFILPQLKHHHVCHISADLSNQLTGWSGDVYQSCQKVALGNITALRQLNTIRTALFNNHFLVKSTEKLTIHLLLYLEKSLLSQCQITIQSVLSQDYPNWYFSIIADFYPEAFMQQKANIRWLYRTEKQSIIQVISQEIAVISANWVALIYPNDRFEPQLFSLSIKYATHYPNWKFIYFDEKNLANQQIFKPAVNIDLLRSTAYIGHFCLIQRQALETVGGYTNYYEYYNEELVFKIIEHYGESCIGHIPYPLYYANNERKNISAYQRVIKEHLQRQHITAQVYSTDFTNSYIVDYALHTLSFISIIIATTQEQDTLERCLTSILTATNYLHYEIIIVDNASPKSLHLTFCQSLCKNSNSVRLIRYPRPAELTTLYNFAVQQAKGEFILFLNDDSEIVQADWLQHLLSNAQRTEVGIVGPKILDSQGNILQAGYILGMGAVGVAGQIHQGLTLSDSGYAERAQVAQNFAAISDNGMMIKRNIYQAVQGMDEKQTAILFNEVDLCLKVTKMGYKIVWLPHAILIQHGTGSVARHRQTVINTAYLRQEIATMYQRWLSQLSHDPSYHPQLNLNGKEWTVESSFITTWYISRGNPFLHTIPRVIAFPNDNWGSGEYRVKIPLNILEKQEVIESHLMPAGELKKIPTLPELQRMQGDVLLLHNFFHTPELELLQDCQFTDYFKIFSQDDLVYTIPPLNSYYHTNYKDIKKRIHHAITLCDRLIVSTEPLAFAYRHIINDIKVVPNYLEFKQWQALTVIPKQGSKPRVGWAGAAQHLGDLRLILPVVEALAKEVDWIFFGMCPNELRPYMREFYPMVAFAHYPAHLAELALDLAIAPLEENVFNEAKSNLRLLEYGILGYPVVCSDIYPYQSAPVTRVKNTPQAWIAAIREKISDLESTQQEGKNLQQWVKKNWLLEDHVDEWKQALSPCINEKYRFESIESIRWIFILSHQAELVVWLKEMLCQHQNITNVVTHCKNVQFNQEAKIPELWTEYVEILPEYEKNLDLINEKQEWLRQFSLNQSVSTCIISGIPTIMARTVWLQQHFLHAYFIFIETHQHATALSLHEILRSSREPLLLQRINHHLVRSRELLQRDILHLQHFFKIRDEALEREPEQTLKNIFDFLNLPSCQFSMKLCSYHAADYLAKISAEHYVNLSLDNSSSTKKSM